MKYLQPVTQRKRALILLLVFLTAIFCMTYADAAEEFPSAVSVKAILPDNQVGNSSYYNLRLAPEARQTVQLQINNADDKPIEATVELNPATTGLNGTIVYTSTDTLDESAKYSVGDIARVRTPVVEIPAKSSALVDIDISMPNDAFDGVILGGLRVTADYPNNISNTAESEQEQGIRIKNRFAYVIGLMLSQNDTEAKPDFHLKSIYPGLINYSTAVVVNIQNSEPAIAKDMPFSARVFEKGSQEVLRELVKDNAEMAPNSNCSYVVDWGNTKIQPGTYRVLVRMQHQDRVWEWDEEFTVDADEAGVINGGALGIEQEITPGIPIWAYVIGIMLLILVVLLIFVLLRQNRKKREP